MKRVVVAAIAVAAVGLIGFNAPTRAATTWPVGVFDGAFRNGPCDPAGQGSVTAIMAGDSVTWTSCSDLDHNVTSDDGKFPTKTFTSKGSTATQVFDSAGTFGYTCTLHGFSGTVVVEAAAATTTLPAPTTPATTAKPATTTSTSTTVPGTTTTFDIGGVFDEQPTSSTTSTTGDPTVTTRALGTGGDSGSSAGVVALLLVGLGAVGTAGALLIRRMRGGGPAEPL